MTPRDPVNAQQCFPWPRHVWVGNDSSPKPGLLLYWRRGRAGWEGYVIEASGGGMTEPMFFARWVPAGELRKA